MYDLECKLCESHYIGKTQQYFKERTQEHFEDVWKVIETGNKNYGPDSGEELVDMHVPMLLLSTLPRIAETAPQ